uniref:Uncharacterized protein n=1 Tax=Phlebotomus papatasi TaxID=29031 RepID=A0A1B0D6F4_PHLPP
MVIDLVDKKLKELQFIIENNSKVIVQLSPYWNSDANFIVGTHIQALFTQMQSWFEQHCLYSQNIFLDIQAILEDYEYFQRNCDVIVPNLSEIQRVCETFFQNLSDINDQFLYVYNNFMISLMCFLGNLSEEVFNSWWSSILKLQRDLIKISLIYEDQPSPIIRKDKQFQAKIRWLIGSKLDNNVVKGLKAKAMIINEDMVNKVRNGSNSFDSVSPVANGEKNFEINQNMEVYAKLQECKVMSIARKHPKTGEERKIDEKYAVMVVTKIHWNNEDIDILLISLPICLITHVTQYEYSLARIMWDYGFSQRQRQAFQVPNDVEWYRLADVLSKIWEKWIGCPLTKEHHDRLFGEDPNSEEIPTRSVNWDKIAKDNIPGMDFTFWTWFYNAMKLIKDKFAEHWRAGYVIGFIHKDHAKALLEPLTNGTFLFRFSESSYGHMSIDVALDNYPRVSSCGPFSEFKTDFHKQNQPEKSLNQFISDFVELLNHIKWYTGYTFCAVIFSFTPECEFPEIHTHYHVVRLPGEPWESGESPTVCDMLCLFTLISYPRLCPICRLGMGSPILGDDCKMRVKC